MQGSSVTIGLTLKYRGENLLFSFKSNEFDTKASVDSIESIVYEQLKPLGFRKYGRTLHRFVDGDISQVINFQNGCPQKQIYNTLWVNLGIRIPECTERSFSVSQPLKKYYHDYDCTIRTELGTFVKHKNTGYNLKRNPHKIGNDILRKLKKFVLPIFDTLNSREAILKHRKDYPNFDRLNNHLRLLEEAMIYGRAGNMEQAVERFNLYYQKALQQYNNELAHGFRMYMHKGQRTMYYNVRTQQMETVTAKRSGYVTLYDANDSHLKYLEKLAETLNIPLYQTV